MKLIYKALVNKEIRGWNVYGHDPVTGEAYAVSLIDWRYVNLQSGETGFCEHDDACTAAPSPAPDTGA